MCDYTQFGASVELTQYIFLFCMQSKLRVILNMLLIMDSTITFGSFKYEY